MEILPRENKSVEQLLVLTMDSQPKEDLFVKKDSFVRNKDRKAEKI